MFLRPAARDRPQRRERAFPMSATGIPRRSRNAYKYRAKEKARMSVRRLRFTFETFFRSSLDVPYCAISNFFGMPIPALIVPITEVLALLHYVSSIFRPVHGPILRNSPILASDSKFAPFFMSIPIPAFKRKKTDWKKHFN